MHLIIGSSTILRERVSNRLCLFVDCIIYVVWFLGFFEGFYFIWEWFCGFDILIFLDFVFPSSESRFVEGLQIRDFWHQNVVSLIVIAIVSFEILIDLFLSNCLVGRERSLCDLFSSYSINFKIQLLFYSLIIVFYDLWK